MDSVKKLQQDIEKIKARNQRVEADKAWEISWERKMLVTILTYFVVVIFFWIALSTRAAALRKTHADVRASGN